MIHAQEKWKKLNGEIDKGALILLSFIEFIETDLFSFIVGNYFYLKGRGGEEKGVGILSGKLEDVYVGRLFLAWYNQLGDGKKSIKFYLSLISILFGRQLWIPNEYNFEKENDLGRWFFHL